MALLHYCYFSYLFSLFLALASTHDEQVALHSQDLHSLLSFKASADPLNTSLHTWIGWDPCSGSWVGVKCSKGRVVLISLDHSSLIGAVTPLLSLTELQILSLRRNSLSGSLPRLSNLTNPKLKHLFLSFNHFSGTLSISLPALLSLRLEQNGFSGTLDGLQVPIAMDFNVSGNLLSGEISAQFLRFPISAFGGNPDLCGSPFPGCVNTSRMFTANIDATLSPSPTPSLGGACPKTGLTKLGVTAVLAIGIGNIVVLSVALASVVIGMYIWFRKKNAVRLNCPSSAVGISSDDGFTGKKKKVETDRGLVCFEGGEDLRLECLLKASAEVLGKGVAGNTYKAVLDGGLMVAAKRLSAVRFGAESKGFDRHMDLMGRIRHCNVVSLRAYCSTNEEKLLVYDYMPNGSLHALLHGNGTSQMGRGSLRSRGLDWKSRKQALMGAAHGLHFIHTFPAQPPLIHANIKPSNILIDGEGNACISEWGIMCFADNSYQASPPPYSSALFSCTSDSATRSAWHGYRAPELLAGKEKASQESDVYSFGMVLLEVVTDKEVDDEDCEGELMGMVKIGMMCTRDCPEERPKMNQVVRMLSEML